MARSKEPTVEEKIVESKKLLATAMHRTLDGALVERYQERSGEFGEYPVFVWLQFSGLPHYRFTCASDGETLLLDLDAPDPVDMGEWGRTLIDDGASNEALACCLGKTVESLDVVVGYSPMIGACFRFSGGRLLYIDNWGDELRLANTRPEPTKQEPLVFRPLVG